MQDSDYTVRLQTLGAMGGDTGKTYNSVYDIDLEILRLTEQGGGGSGTTYTAGTGITISDNTISVDPAVVQNKLTAGANITISGSEISATDTKYTAGTGISISENNEISVDTNVIQPKLTAGTGIEISGDTISVVNNDSEYKGLCFLSSGSSTVGLSALSQYHTVEYSKDLTTWSTLSVGAGNAVSLTDGEKLYVRGILTQDNTNSDFTTFKITGNVKVYGNLNYIWNYENPNAALKNYCGNRMFAECANIKDVSGLLLPAETLSEGCYQQMFLGCQGITQAPALPARNLVANCYQQMFYFCINLKLVKCLATSGINKNSSTGSWLSQTASAGTFIKTPNYDSWGRGVNKIPYDWTIIDEIDNLDKLNADKQDKLTAGDGIEISGNTISVDTDVIQTKLTAGTGITISGNTISTVAVQAVSLTQAEYDALVAGGTVDANTLYIITDAQ